MMRKILRATKVNFVSVRKAEIIPYHSCITAVFGTICVHVHMTGMLTKVSYRSVLHSNSKYSAVTQIMFKI